MKRTNLICALLLALSIQSAQSRIGETLEECTVRYGLYLDDEARGIVKSWPDARKYTFRQGEFLIVGGFVKGRAEVINYSKLSQSDSRRPFTEEEIQELLRKNHPGEWVVDGPIPGWKDEDYEFCKKFDPALSVELERERRVVKHWYINNGEVRADYDTEHLTLTIKTETAINSRAGHPSVPRDEEILKGL